MDDFFLGDNCDHICWTLLPTTALGFCPSLGVGFVNSIPKEVGQFVNCLVEARNELKQKSEVIQRSFKIKKALLFKADRSSFHRLCQQIYKLEAVHKRLEEDAAVYNLLQEQLKLSPAYKTMVKVGARIELKDAEDQAMEFSDISFEELLAREKKDSFW
ncbi:hypothetical protein HPP92_003967 [Vanilla planifolia]|uniref:Uncharacterized protein n=1 Tax=Vanilla planifolia TaxID=51239 RepID=A0A835S3G1_VANPL|nr:hypothetical protein HPP92_003967 [Vanilla planifolia]